MGELAAVRPHVAHPVLEARFGHHHPDLIETNITPGAVPSSAI
jgi:hypothetical protein